MITSGLGLLDISKALLTTPLSQSEVNQFWRKETALSFAIGNGEYEITELLVNAGANINDIDSDEQIKSALEIAVENNRADIISLLLDNKAGVNAALITAAQNWIPRTPPPDLFRLVLARDGAFEPSMRARLLDAVMTRRHGDLFFRDVKRVLSYPTKSSIDETMQRPLFLAFSGHRPRIDLCSLIVNDPAIYDIDKCWSYNYSTSAGLSLIHYIVERSQHHGKWDPVEHLKLVRARGASLDKESKGSAFYSAIYSGNVVCVEFFLREDPHLTTLHINEKEIIWPIATAALNRDYNMVRCLLIHGADIDHGTGNMSSYDRDCYYSDILIATTHEGISNMETKIKGGLLDTLSTQQLQKAINYGLNIDMELERKTFLSYAASSGNVDRVRWLVQHGANVDSQTSDGRSIRSPPLMEAIWYCDDMAAIIVEILLDYGANVNEPRDHKVHNGPVVASPAHIAIIKNNQQVLQLLLAHNADVNLQGNSYGVLLKEATVNGKLHLMKLLAFYGADVNAIGQGTSVLHEAVFNRQLEAVSVLLDLGAYINILDYAQGTPLQLSKAMHYGEMMSFLQRRGALEVCNLKSVKPSYFHHQARRHTSTNSLVLSRNEIEMPDPQAFSRRQSVALQSWVT
ncbi:hypothetical protein BTUL_0114g00350 [Botrytis tulipae]|uniref:Uncharacterized protein n=1 Tax=Botrytis tulipae TaxID=87230 RepID=A0A4Z1EQG6_9HELO|nr:hypothetical protein BTUL_0114g00350 [Botrytis tulipae]